MPVRPVTAGLAIVALATASTAALGRAAEAEFPARAGKSRLVFECNQDNKDKAVWLRVWNPVRGWRAERPSEVRIGETRFKTEVDGATDSFILSDVPSPGIGVTPALLAAAKSGEELVLAGPAAEQIPGPSRSFPLTGARAKIERVEKACGLSLSAAGHAAT